MSSNTRTCVVTGASRGIGSGIAERLAEDGLNVVVNYRSSEGEAYDVVDRIEAAGGTAIAVQADVTDREEVEGMRERIHDAFGPVDVLVNNAGITVDRTFKNMTREEWDRVMDVNLGGVFNCTKVFYDDIKESDGGRIINISSVVGQQGNYGQANYATTKSGLFGFTRTLALELAKSEATVNCVAPGFTQTDMLAEVSEEVQGKIRQRIPLDRFAEVEDISGMVAFLAGPESSYMTGQVLGINGGMEW
ncbi:beta-ketoacyl-ACP reductase [Halobium salinum]|uniref:Beta-ketoacyl-ACP reductase n=1 Tax=Halobium salinum TaxID=1364940 RepID=A0ABD5PB01_9EURY|nr:beta-ketoacyl-ACP reductase [Halobium salinum]